jgi:hypothetical protein
MKTQIFHPISVTQKKTQKRNNEIPSRKQTHAKNKTQKSTTRIRERFGGTGNIWYLFCRRWSTVPVAVVMGGGRWGRGRRWREGGKDWGKKNLGKKEWLKLAFMIHWFSIYFILFFYRRFGPKPFENLTFETVWDQTVNKFHNSFKTNRCNFFFTDGFDQKIVCKIFNS